MNKHKNSIPTQRLVHHQHSPRYQGEPKVGELRQPENHQAIGEWRQPENHQKNRMDTFIKHSAEGFHPYHLMTRHLPFRHHHLWLHDLLLSLFWAEIRAVHQPQISNLLEPWSHPLMDKNPTKLKVLVMILYQKKPKVRKRLRQTMLPLLCLLPKNPSMKKRNNASIGVKLSQNWWKPKESIWPAWTSLLSCIWSL